MTNNGKLDRRSLPEPNINDIIKEEYIEPDTEVEKSICEIFERIFNMEEKSVGKYSDFCDLGGDSLNAIKVVYELEKKFKIKIGIKNVLKYSVVNDLSEYIEKMIKNNKEKEKEKNIEIIKRYNMKEFPLTPLLRGVMFSEDELNSYSINASKTNMYKYYLLNDNIDLEKLTDNFRTIINRHSVLKSIFIEKDVNGKKMLYCKPRDNEIDFEIEHYTKFNFTQFIRPYDLTKDILIRVGLIENKVLIIDMDHKVSDGYSFGILLNELNKLYNGETLQDLPIQFSDYAINYYEKISSDGFKDQINYYKSMFNCEYQPQTFTQKDNNIKMKKVNSNKLKVLTVNTDYETYNTINKITKENKLSKTALFITLSSLVLSAYSEQQNIFLNIVSSNRTTNNTSNLIGLFVRFLPMLIKIENLNLIDLIKKYMNILMTLYSFDVPFLKVKSELNLDQCNSLFKFDPYELFELNNYEEHRMIESITPNEISKLFNIKFSMEENEINLSYEFFDFVTIVSEFKNYYRIKFMYNEELYNENIMNKVAKQLLAIMKCENYYSENAKTIINRIKSMNNMNNMLCHISYEINENENTNKINLPTNLVDSKKNIEEKHIFGNKNNDKFKKNKKKYKVIIRKIKNILNKIFLKL